MNLKMCCKTSDCSLFKCHKVTIYIFIQRRHLENTLWYTRWSFKQTKYFFAEASCFLMYHSPSHAKKHTIWILCLWEVTIPEALELSHLFAAGVSTLCYFCLLLWQWLHIKRRSFFFYCDGRTHKAHHFNSYILHDKFSCHTWVNPINCHLLWSAKLASDLCLVFFLCEGCAVLFSSSHAILVKTGDAPCALLPLRLEVLLHHPWHAPESWVIPTTDQ